MRVSYRCKACGTEFVKTYSSSPVFNVTCPHCGKVASRIFGSVATSKEDESVSGALQLMLYSKKPSQVN